MIFLYRLFKRSLCFNPNESVSTVITYLRTNKQKTLKGEKYIEGLLRHDNRVLSEIYENYANRIQNLVTKKGGTVDDAKDIFHDALLVIYQKAQAPDFVLTASFYTYLYSICAFMWDRKRKKKVNNMVTIPAEERLTIDDSVIAGILRREKQKIFAESLVKIGINCQRILRLFFARKSMTEIATEMGFENEHIARTRKYRCTKELEKIVRADARYAELTDKKTTL